jgi:hypothetical protein
MIASWKTLPTIFLNIMLNMMKIFFMLLLVMILEEVTQSSAKNYVLHKVNNVFCTIFGHLAIGKLTVTVLYCIKTHADQFNPFSSLLFHIFLTG